MPAAMPPQRLPVNSRTRQYMPSPEKKNDAADGEIIGNQRAATQPPDGRREQGNTEQMLRIRQSIRTREKNVCVEQGERLEREDVIAPGHGPEVQQRVGVGAQPALPMRSGSGQVR